MNDDSPRAAERPPHPLAVALIERLAPRRGAAVLVHGAGSGRNTSALERAGFTVRTLDDAGPASCAAGLSTHALLHGTPATIAASLERIADVLEPSAPFYATFGSVDDARFGKGEELESFVYAAPEGDEEGVAHTFFDCARLAPLLEQHFTIEALDQRGVDAIAGSWAHERRPLRDAVHWFALLRNGGAGARLMRDADASVWAAMRADLWPEADAEELACESRAILAGAGDLRVFVSEHDAGQIDGMLELSLRSVVDGCDGSPVPFIEAWYVRPSARGRGVGAELVETAKRWARAHGFTELASDTQIENQGSIAAHLALGFAEVERAVHFRMPLIPRE